MSPQRTDYPMLGRSGWVTSRAVLADAKHDVRLDVKPSDGIDVNPRKILVKASDKPDSQVRIAIPKDAAIGDYRVYVKGTPQDGQPTSVEFKVKVVAP